MMDLHDVDGTEVVAKGAQNYFMPFRETMDPLKGRNLCFPEARFSFIVFRTLYFSKENTSENK